MLIRVQWIFLIAIVVGACVALGQADNEENVAFENYLKTSIQTYPDWLASKDSLIPDTIHLKSDNASYFGVEADFIIKNQYMSGHSSPNRSRTVVTSLALLTSKVFSVSYATFFDEYFVIGGEYMAYGTAVVENGNDVCFHGDGNWSLKGSDPIEMAGFSSFIVNKDGYIDLALTSEDYSSYLYNIVWRDFEFQGLELSPCENRKRVENSAGNVSGTFEADENEEHLNRIKYALMAVYRNFLNSFQEHPNKVIPPKRLLFEYITEVLLKMKLSDIISIRPTPPTTDGTTPDSGTPPNSAKMSSVSYEMSVIILYTIIGYHELLFRT